MSGNSLSRNLPLVFVAIALAACDHPAPPTRPTGVPPKAGVAIVSGSEQDGFLNLTLSDDLVVRVSDASGAGVPNVPVEWNLTTGSGDLRRVADGAPATTTLTNVSGVASISLRPTSLGPLTVSATAPAMLDASATFRIFARRKPDVVIHILPGFDCGDPSIFKGPGDVSDVIVPVGGIVEWVYAEAATTPYCTAHVRSIEVPPGGTEFAQSLGIHERFQYVPEVAGKWVFTDANNGGRGTLTARAP